MNISSAGPGRTPELRAVRVGSRLNLFDLLPAMYADLHRCLVDPAVATTWRTRGRTLSTAEFERTLLEGSHYSCVALDHSGHLVGLLQLIGFHTQDGYADVAVAEFGPYLGSGLIIEALALFLDECFFRFPLRKVYATMSDSAVQRVASGIQRYFTLEGVLRDHVYLDGTYQNVSVYAITREDLKSAIESGTTISRVSPSGWKIAPGPQANGGAFDDTEGALLSVLTELAARPISSVEREINLWDDIGIDSCGVMELVVVLEEITGREIVAPALFSLLTVGDLLDFAVSVRQ